MEQKSQATGIEIVRATIAAAPDAALVFALRGLECLGANQRGVQNLGYADEELAALTLAEIFPDAIQEPGPKTIRALLAGETEQVTLETAIRSADGAMIPVRATFRRLDLAADPILVVWCRPPESVQPPEQLPGHATVDPLTKLPNRAAFEGQLSRAVERAKSGEARFAVLFVDLDGFKRINDEFGHLTGDEVLAEMARRLSGCVRADDLAARYGGDEFVLLLANVDDESQVAAVKDRVRAAVAVPVDVRGSERSITVSIGSVIGNAAQSPAELLELADTAMYRDKKARE